LTEENKLYVAKIIDNTIVDGEGFRTSLYLTGCDICCDGCHNNELWDINAGQVMTVEDVYKKITKYFTNITFIGGEPMLQAPALTLLAFEIKKNTDKTIWIYSGHTYEEIIGNDVWSKLLGYCDVLVDGRYEKDLFKNNLKFRGSVNQRIIDIKSSIMNDKVVPWDDTF